MGIRLLVCVTKQKISCMVHQLDCTAYNNSPEKVWKNQQFNWSQHQSLYCHLKFLQPFGGLFFLESIKKITDFDICHFFYHGLFFFPFFFVDWVRMYKRIFVVGRGGGMTKQQRNWMNIILFIFVHTFSSLWVHNNHHWCMVIMCDIVSFFF